MTQKRVTIKLLGEAKEEYLKLQETVKQEIAKGITQSFHQTLLRSINSKFELLKVSHDYGIQIPKKQIPRTYLEKYEVTNLWKVNLSGYWRLIYTLKQPQREETEIDIITIWLDVLDIIDHPTYDKMFGYRKK
ncbi:hypothetical protein HY988_06680 [Candidatus Micrarchaeota archaeon]|nr:hypothetical protein [Candidatus Micrarchaeota archaeon]